MKNMFNAFFPALEREKHTNMGLEKQRLPAEEENARQRERSRQIEREKNMITRELNQRENENEYLVCLNYFVSILHGKITINKLQLHENRF